MVYLGHFSFESHSSGAAAGAAIGGSDASDKSGAWHGYLTCIAEADSVERGLEKFESLLHRLRQTTSMFSDVDEVYLDSCNEITSIPKRAFLSYFCEIRGACQEKIATSLHGVTGRQAVAYQLSTDTTPEKGDAVSAEPFVTFRKNNW
jgi:hypothetical protein